MKLKLDLHVHSYKSFDSTMTYNDIISAAKKKGLDGVCICDHACTDIKESMDNNNDDFIIIPAVEFTTGKHHIIGMFLENVPQVSFGERFIIPFKDIVDTIHKNGGICIIAHPYERLQDGVDAVSQRIDEMMKTADGIEIYNSRAPYKYSKANKLAIKKAKELNTVCITSGSDAHTESEIGGAYCIVDTPSRSLNDIKNSILAGKVEAFGKHTKRTNITRSELIKTKKIPANAQNKFKLYLSYPIRAVLDIFDIFFGRNL